MRQARSRRADAHGEGAKLAGEVAMSFKHRSEAGRKLAKALAAYKDQHPVILALPRGGVPVALLRSMRRLI